MRAFSKRVNLIDNGNGFGIESACGGGCAVGVVAELALGGGEGSRGV